MLLWSKTEFDNDWLFIGSVARVFYKKKKVHFKSLRNHCSSGGPCLRSDGRAFGQRCS